MIDRLDEHHQTEPWKNDVARQCNELTELAAILETTPLGFSKAYQARTVETLRSIVRRVAEFEDLDRQAGRPGRVEMPPIFDHAGREM